MKMTFILAVFPTKKMKKIVKNCLLVYSYALPQLILYHYPTLKIQLKILVILRQFDYSLGHFEAAIEDHFQSNFVRAL